jgi:hypothetical protein
MRYATAGLVLLTAIAACGGGPAEPADVGMRVRVTLSASRAPVGDTVLVGVNAVNVTGAPLSLGFLGPCSVSFEVLDGAGAVVAPETPLCPIIDFVPIVAAGARIGVTFPWRGERQPGTGSFLPPGVYRVRGLLDTDSGFLRGEFVTLELTEQED